MRTPEDVADYRVQSMSNAVYRPAMEERFGWRPPVGGNKGDESET